MCTLSTHLWNQQDKHKQWPGKIPEIMTVLVDDSVQHLLKHLHIEKQNEVLYCHL